MPSSGKKSSHGDKKKSTSVAEGQNQRTISSFFKAGQANPAKSSLFSEVGKSTGGKLTLRKTNSKTKYKESPPLKSGESSSHAIVIDSDLKPERNQIEEICNGKENNSKAEKLIPKQSKNSSGFTVVKDSSLQAQTTSSAKGDKNGSSTCVGAHVCVIPETQICVAAKTPKIKGHHDDEELIPDTPQSEKKEDLTKKKIFGRSFLTAGTNLAQNPYVLKKEKVDKKQISKARKGILSISVKFNSSENAEGKRENDSKSADMEVSDSSKTEVEQCPVEKLVKEDDMLIVSDIDTASKDHIEENIILEADTPTKVYNGERVTLKRMSKCGISPDSKRFVESLDFDSGSGRKCETSVKLEEIIQEHNTESKGYASGNNRVNKISPSRISDKGDVTSADKELCSTKDKKCNVKSLLPKTDSSISYQLSMKRKKKDQNREISENIHDDDCLGDILGELDSKNSKTVSSVNSFQPSVISLKKGKSFSKRTSIESPCMLSKSFNESLTEDDLKYLNDLDEKVHRNVSSSLEDKPSSPDTSANKNTFQKPGFITKKAMLKKTKQDMSNNKLGDMKEDDIVPTQMIVEYLSQMGKETEEKEELDIAEYPTQTTITEVINGQESLSVIEKQKKDDDVKPASVSLGRHQVRSVEHKNNGHELFLHLSDTVTEEEKTCILSGFWADTHVLENDLVHIMGTFVDGTCHITDNEGLIIVNPDILLSGTTVVSSVFCMRKGVLNEKFKGCDGGNIQMLYGSIIHSVFQQVLQKKLTTEEEILKEGEETVQQARFLHDMYKGNTTEGEVLEEIKKYIPQIRKWLEQYTNLGNKSEKNRKDDVVITKVKDIEENIWCPRYGVKGKIDLTVEVEIKNNGKKEKSVLPLELKTGRATFSMEHKGQVTLYSMMSSDRREDPGQGLLLYLKEPDMKLVPANHLNIRGLVQLRNEMAYYLSRQVSKTTTEGQMSYHMGRLPDPISNQRACLKCAQLTNCCIYQKEKELVGDDGENLVLEEIGHGRSSAEIWVKFKGAKTGKNLFLESFSPKSSISQQLNAKSVTELINSVTANCPWIDLKRKKRKECSSDGRKVKEMRMEVGEGDISVSYNMGSLKVPYKENYLGRFQVNILTLSEPPQQYQARHINQEWINMLKRKIKSRPNMVATVLPVLIDTEEVGAVEQFKAERLSTYNLYTLGGNHLRVALTQLSQESYLNDIRNVHIDVYFGLDDDQAIDIANIHNGLMASLKPNFEDCVLQAREFYLRENGQKLAEKVSRMMSDIEMKEVPKESIGTIVSVASYSEVNFENVLILFKQYKQKFGSLKNFPQVLFKELQGIEEKERGPYLELAIQNGFKAAVSKCREDKKRGKLEKCFMKVTSCDNMAICQRLFPDHVRGIDNFLDIEIRNNLIPQCFIDYCKDALEISTEEDRTQMFDPKVDINVKFDDKDMTNNVEIQIILAEFKKKIANVIIKKKSKILNCYSQKKDETAATCHSVSDSGILDLSVLSDDSTQPPDTSNDLFDCSM